MFKLVALTFTACLANAQYADVPQFNNTLCPAWYELESEQMKDFDINKFPGTYYELAFHDRTQYPTCPTKPACIRSKKSWVPDVGDGKFQIKDEFTLGCAGKLYTEPLYFNTTNATGSLDGFLKKEDIPWWWKLFEPGSYYPDTIVDYQLNKETGDLDWVIEFQCH